MMARVETPIWQPVTLRGVARFAQAPLRRLLLVEVVIATICATVTVWVLAVTWFPALDTAISRLPDDGFIRHGQLGWPETAPPTLVESRFLAIVVDPAGAMPPGSVSDLQVVFGRDAVKLGSMFGYFSVRYPQGWIISFNRIELEPSWGAWRPAILALTAIGVVVGLLLAWSILALLYLGFAAVLAFYADREMRPAAGWRVASAALMPGALLLAGALFLYGWQGLPLAGLILAFGLHLVTGWIYLALAVLQLPRLKSRA